ncbi:titin-like [Spea bombifrons]|uniref:titin-like n=1 Tax=Spea bombifrons TaxID=233779 RepID=UPI00234A8666|nr:titin-like [Spea bombifrons]
MGLLGVARRATLLLLLVGLLILKKASGSCDDVPECRSISIQTTTSQITVANMAQGFALQNITYLNGTVPPSSSISNNVSVTGLTSGTRFLLQYGNSSLRCCQNVTTKPMVINQLRDNIVTSDSISLTWIKPNEYNSDYSYRVQANSSAGMLINETIVTSESVTVTNLTPGETYTFTVFTRAADGITESQPASYTTCTLPGAPQNISVQHYNSTNSLLVTWIEPPGKVSYYNVTLRGVVNQTTQTNSTRVNFNDLLPGREYSVTIQTVSGTCSRTSDPVKEATYPTPPGPITFLSIGTKSVSLSWGDPINMTNAEKFFNITYRTSSDTRSVSSNVSNINLQNLTSGTKYTISVVTVGAREYQSPAVSRDVYTKPMVINQLQNNMTSESISLTWNKSDEYNSDYSYRVQTNSSAGMLVNETIVRSESVTVTNLTAGETYTFTVFTRAADGVTESQPASYTTCTLPGTPQNISVQHYNSTNSLLVTWIEPPGKVSYYNVTLRGVVSQITQTNSTGVNFTDLLPGREYSVTILTVSGTCSRTSDPVKEATYPTPPGAITFLSIETKSVSLSWGDPINMTNAEKFFNITYRTSSDTRSVSSNVSNINLQNLTSGTKYTFSVVTVGAREYQSSAVSRDVYTKPMVINQLRENIVTSDSISLTWNKSDEYNSDYSYRVQTNLSAGMLINETIVRSESVTVTNLTAGETYTFTVFTRAADGITESQPTSYTTCTLPGAPQNISVQHYNSMNSLLVTWIEPPGKVSYYNVTLRGVVNQTTQTNSPRVNFTDLLPGREYSVTILTVSGTCSRTSDPVKEATYPTPPGSITFLSIGTKSVSLLWGDTINMTNTEKSFNVTYRTSSDTRSVSSNVSNINLQNLTSGTKYTISVVTVGAREYQSSAVSRDVYTKPMVINQLQKNNLTSESISLTWNKSNEYNSDYSYRVQTNSSAGMLINETIVRSESVTVTNLTPGETYTFTVFTRAADGVTESQPASYTTCTLPGTPQNISVQHYNSTNSLLVTWIEPPGKVSYYNVTLRGVVSQITQTNSTGVNFTDLLPGREYSVTILTVSGTCSRTSDPVKEATYPTPPGAITFLSIETKSVSLSWGDPINMTNAEKFFNITYRTSSDTRSVSSNVSNINLQNLTSGTKYTFSVVTVGAREYQSSAVSRDVYTKPMVINQLRENIVTSDSISLTWNKSDEYNSDYSYRVQTNLSAGMLINETIVRSESVTVTNLTAGETYTFTVFTRAADGITESQPTSYTTCTLPGAPQNISVQHYNSMNSLLVTWIEPPGKVSYYNVTLRGVVNQTTQTNSPRVNFTDLLPGREYSVTILTVSGTCSRTSDPVKEATYPTPPGSITFLSIGTKSVSLSWGDTINMTNTEKSFNVTYRTSSDTRSVSSNVSNINLQNLTSGTKYTISVVTVGAREYQSSAVSRDVYTKPMVINQLQKNNLTSESISLTWNKSNEYNSDYSYRVQTNSSAGMLINETIVRSESVTVTNLTPGETYTFTVFTRAADGLTESQPTSYTTCTCEYLPRDPQNISVQHYNSTNSLLVTWIEPPGKVSYYNVTLRGVVNQTTQTNSTRVNFTDLLPGREYSVTIQTVSGTCSRTSDPVKEATYPTPPGSITFLSIGTKTVSLSWGDPINMTNAEKFFNITYRTSSDTRSVSSNVSNINLQNLTSGTKYTISVVTVGAREYQSSAVSRDVYTKPMVINQLQKNNLTSESISLTWNKSDEYNSDYSYRVQTNSSAGMLINETIVRSESVTVTNLTAGETYTFTVFTRAADGVTESQPASYTTCTLPGTPQNISIQHHNSMNSLLVTWIEPPGKVSYYNVTLRGVVNQTTQTNSTRVNFTDLLPGREYSVTIQTVSGTCSRTSDPVKEATYPTPPGPITFLSIETKSVSLSWGDPINMTNAEKFFNITYRTSSDTRSVSSNVSNINLQNLTSGTKYTISVVTVGAREYQSSAVSRDVYTKPMVINQLRENIVTSESISLTWNKSDEYNSDYSYRVQTNSSAGMLINETIVRSESVTVTNLTAGETYTFTVFTRAADGITESQPASYTTCTLPGTPQNISVQHYNSMNSLLVTWIEPPGKVSYYNVTLRGVVNQTTQTNSTRVNFTDLLPGREYSVTIQTVSGTCSRTSDPVKEATYPTSPGAITFLSIETKSVSLSWGDPINMTNAEKFFNITYRTSSDTRSVSSNVSNINLQNLTSGTKYTISVVTVGAREYQSSAVSRDVYTKPMVINQLQNNVTSESISLTWNKPNEYNNDYSYRVQANSSAGMLINETIVRSESVTVTNLTPGETYTFTVFTRAADGVTESQPASYTTCTVPGIPGNIIVKNNNSTNSILVTWVEPPGKVSYYNVTLRGVVSQTTQANSTRVNFTDLLPGREYSVTILTVSGNCSRTSDPVKEATYPTPPGSITFLSIETKSISLSWGDPINMTNAEKSFNVTYRTSSGTRSVSSNVSNINLQNLTSGTKYTISVVTVGAREYQSSAVSRDVYTIPGLVGSRNIQLTNMNSTNFLHVNWTKSDGIVSYYNVTLNGDVNRTIQTNSTTADFPNLLPGREYSVIIQTVSGTCSRTSDPVTEATYPTPPGTITSLSTGTSSVSFSWGDPINMKNATKSFNVTYRNSSGTWSVSSNASNINLQNLTSGTKYTISVVTVGAQKYQSSAVSTDVYTIPGVSQNIIVKNNNSINSLLVTWIEPPGTVSYYNVTLRGVVNQTTQTNSTGVKFNDLLPGREYSVTIQTVSGTCSRTSDPVTEATYPTPPGSIPSLSPGTNNVSLSWGDPIEMTNAEKSFNVTYRNSSGAWSVSSNVSNITLQNLRSGTKYTISVVTVGAQKYQSSAVSTDVYTTPMPVRNLRAINATSGYVFLIWDTPDEYNSDYSYRVQTKSSSGNLINETTVRSELYNVTNLVAGETYTFTVFTRAGDNITESQPASYTTCTVPGVSQNIIVKNNNSINSLLVTWIEPPGKVSYYNVTLRGVVNQTTQTNSTRVNFTDLLPGREYSVTIQTVSGTCSRTSDPVKEATYPTPPGSITALSTGTNNVSLSWGDPIEMTNAEKSFNVTYRNSSGAWSVSSNVSNINLQNLRSGTNYTISVVTVGAQKYQSSPVSEDVCTGKFPLYASFWAPVKPQMEYRNSRINTISAVNCIIKGLMFCDFSSHHNYPTVTSAGDFFFLKMFPAAVLSFSCAAFFGQASLSLKWTCPDTLFTNFGLTLTSQGSFRELNISRNCSAGSPEFNVTDLMFFTEYSISITTLACKKASDAKISSCQTSIGRPPDINTQIIELAGPSLYDQFDITFREFNDSNGRIVAYAVIVTVGINVTGQKPRPGILSKTYSDHKTGSTNTYVTRIVNTTQRTTSGNGLITVRVGDGSSTRAYTNGPLAPLTSYWISIAGFTAINDGMIMEDQSLLSYCPYSSEFKTPENTGVIIGAVVGCILGVAAISIMGSFIWWKRRQGGKKKRDFFENKMKNVAYILRNFWFESDSKRLLLFNNRSQSIRCVSFASHFAKQQADMNLGFSRDYERLASVGVTQSKTAAEDPENRRKNRYTNVLPYDVSRVKLSIKDNPTDDYINANYIPGYRSDKEFIAAQGPLPHTVNDFWRMIWEKNIRTIVIVTKCVESGKVKCEEYWPTGRAAHFDKLVVSLKGESVFPEWTIRNFTVTNKTNKEIQVRQFHFTAWPDHGVPKTANILISFRNIVCDYTKLIPDSPILVHCSAGVGRTGTFIALDRVIRQIEAEDKLDIFGAVYDLRMHRVLMVQTESQYIFLNQCALDFIKAKEDKPDLIYQNTAEIYENIYPSLGVLRTNI